MFVVCICFANTKPGTCSVPLLCVYIRIRKFSGYFRSCGKNAARDRKKEESKASWCAAIRGGTGVMAYWTVAAIM